jgi:hypothetical protein
MKGLRAEHPSQNEEKSEATHCAHQDPPKVFD